MNLQDIFTKLISVCALKKKLDKAIGIYADNENIFCVNLELVKLEESQIEQWKVTDTAEIKISDDNSILDSDEKLQELIAEKVAALFKYKLWQPSHTALYIDSDKIIVDIENLSNIPKDKISASVNYQIAAVGDFEVDTYLSSFIETGEEVWMEGISKADAERWSQAFQDNGLELSVLTSMPDEFNMIESIDLSATSEEFLERGGMKAILAARSLIYQTSPNFFPERTAELNDWNYKRINIVMVILTFLVISGIATFDFWNYKQVEAELEYEREKLLLLEPERRKEELIEKRLAALRNKNKIITNLRESSLNWRKLLIYFGSVKIQGVWLKEIRSLDNGSIEIKGESVSYGAISNYIRALENDREIFSKVELKSSAMDSSGQLVQFTIWLSF